MKTELAKEWHPTKNEELTPYNVRPGSDKKVWWKCKNGHEWEAKIYHRSKGSGCPYCSGRNATNDHNLALLNYKLSQEWHSTKNGDLTPYHFRPGSNKKVWWKCNRGHEWEAEIVSRSSGSGCPYCSGRKADANTNLALLNPEIAKEWDPNKNGALTPYNVRPGSGKKIWWICKKGHEWQATIADRTHNRGCPYCSGRRAGADSNLSILHPKLAQEWHPTKNNNLSPLDVRPGSNRKIWWKCKNGHEWKAVINSRKDGCGCPYCSERKASSNNNLAIVHPEIAKEWHPEKNGNLTPYDVRPGSGKRIWWICKNGHEWQTKIHHRSKGSGCPKCSYQTSKIEISIFSELQAIFDIIRWRDNINGIECDIYIPDYKIAIEVDGSYWHKTKEKKDREKDLKLASSGIAVFRVREFGLKRISETDVVYAAKEKELSIIKRLLNILLLHSALNKKIRYRINDYLKRDLLVNRKEFKRICSFLPGPLPDKSLSHLYPKISKEWNFTKNAPLKPEMFSPGTDIKVWWINEKGQEWEAPINSRTRGTYWNGKKAGDDNNLAVLNPQLAKEWHTTKNGELKPYYFSPGSQKRVWWKCENGHEWEATISSRKYGIGCPYCSGRNATKDNNLAILNPKLASQWHPTNNGSLKPGDVKIHSNKKVWWKCEKRHEWQAVINYRNNGIGCPYCSGMRAGIDNSLAILNPQLAKEWHMQKNGDLTPNDVRPGSSRKAWWLCKSGHEWRTAISHRSNGQRCPYCAGKKVGADNNLSVLNSELAKEWHPTKNGKLTANDVRPGSHLKVWWKCKHRHEWVAVIKSRTSGHGCPYCARQKKDYGKSKDQPYGSRRNR